MDNHLPSLPTSPPPQASEKKAIVHSCPKRTPTGKAPQGKILGVVLSDSSALCHLPWSFLHATRIWRCRPRSAVVRWDRARGLCPEGMEAGSLAGGCPAGRCCSSGIDPAILLCRDEGGQPLQVGAISSVWECFGLGSKGISL